MAITRKLLPSDAPRVLAHLLRLDRADRHLRFGYPASDHAIEKYARRLDWSGVVYGHLHAGEVRALAELAIGAPGTPAEATFTVEPGWRSHGIGRALMERVLASAAARGVSSVHLLVRPNNMPMRRLATRHGFVCRLVDGDMLCERTVNRATLFDLMAERTEDALASSGAFWDLALGSANRFLTTPSGCPAR